MPTESIKERNNKLFKRNLAKSQKPVKLVANLLENQGYSVVIPPYTVAPTHEEWKNHVDDGDLIVTLPGKGEFRIEVKHISTSFTNSSSWPYGQTMIVCAKHAYDGANPKPYAYVILSKEKTHVIVVKCSTHSEWFSERLRDKRYGPNYYQNFYKINKKYVTFVKFDEVPSTLFGEICL